jgi:hypothetical protein
MRYVVGAERLLTHPFADITCMPRECENRVARVSHVLLSGYMDGGLGDVQCTRLNITYSHKILSCMKYDACTDPRGSPYFAQRRVRGRLGKEGGYSAGRYRRVVRCSGRLEG